MDANRFTRLITAWQTHSGATNAAPGRRGLLAALGAALLATGLHDSTAKNKSKNKNTRASAAGKKSEANKGRAG